MIDPEAISELGTLAEGWMKSQVEIWRHALQPDTSGWDDSTDVAVNTGGDPDIVTIGWFRNQPDHRLGENLAALAHDEDGRLFLPLGTELERRDLVRVKDLDEDGNPTGAGTEYRVIDTNSQNTWKVLVRASLMRLA